METHMEIIWPPVQGSSLQLCTSTSSGHSSPPWAASLATDRTLAELRKMRKKVEYSFLEIWNKSPKKIGHLFWRYTAFFSALRSCGYTRFQASAPFTPTRHLAINCWLKKSIKNYRSAQPNLFVYYQKSFETSPSENQDRGEDRRRRRRSNPRTGRSDQQDLARRW